MDRPGDPIDFRGKLEMDLRKSEGLAADAGNVTFVTGFAADCGSGILDKPPTDGRRKRDAGGAGVDLMF